ncbi:hypothetical protein [Pedobacter antarcticus]|uniref:hypothetical protein n=1 Tax=Pedobacter antarcticus TaxID=34086 RepID=UPI0029302812|nr:hypothetical protein [Pedobacter antarcticus]
MAVTNKNISDYDKRREIATKAFEGGFVIFSQASQKWYTPREFLDSNEQVTYTKAGVSVVPNVNFYYPAYAIKKRMEKLQLEEKDFNDFMDRVNIAFEMVPRKKTKKEELTKRKEEIVFKAKYKGKSSTFSIFYVEGQCGSWVLYIDKYYYGSFIIYQGDWDFRPQHDNYFTPEQKEILLNKLRKFRPVKESE